MKLEIVTLELAHETDYTQGERNKSLFHRLVEGFSAEGQELFTPQDFTYQRAFLIERPKLIRLLAWSRELAPCMTLRVFSLAPQDDQLIAQPAEATTIAAPAHYDMKCPASRRASA